MLISREFSFVSLVGCKFCGVFSIGSFRFCGVRGLWWVCLGVFRAFGFVWLVFGFCGLAD